MNVAQPPIDTHSRGEQMNVGQPEGDARNNLARIGETTAKGQCIEAAMTPSQDKLKGATICQRTPIDKSIIRV